MAKLNTTALVLGGVGVGAMLAAKGLLSRRRIFDFAGKTVLITGGSRGLGLVMARRFATEGARIAICARDPEEVSRAVEDLRSRGGDAVGFTCDVSDRTRVTEMVNEISERFGGIDVLVNNAGVIQVGPIEVMTLEDFEQAMNIHFWGPLYLTMATLPLMKQRGGGRIINISSIGGKISVPHLVPYSASKFALAGFSEGLRAELMKDSIYVTTVCPGLMRTGSPINAEFKGKHKAEYAWFSISDSLPLISIDADRAAMQIVDACRRGDAELIISMPAKLAVRFRGLFPGLTSDLMAVANRVLPGPGGIGTESAKGRESESAITSSILTVLSRNAAVENNEIGVASAASSS